MVAGIETSPLHNHLNFQPRLLICEPIIRADLDQH